MNRPNAIVVGSEISPSFLGLVRRAFELCSERELSLTAVIVSSTEPVDAGQLIYAGADRLARIALSVQDINATCCGGREHIAIRSLGKARVYSV